jgi:hypothetical protein
MWVRVAVEWVFLEYFGIPLPVALYSYIYPLTFKPYKISTERLVKVITSTSNKSFLLVLQAHTKKYISNSTSSLSLLKKKVSSLLQPLQSNYISCTPCNSLSRLSYLTSEFQPLRLQEQPLIPRHFEK